MAGGWLRGSHPVAVGMALALVLAANATLFAAINATLFRPTPFRSGEKTVSLVKSDLCATDVAGIRYGNRTGNRVIMGSYGDWDLRAKLRTLTVPTLVVHGEEESIPMDLVEEWVTSMPNARLMKVPRAAHFTYAERPELVWPAVERFLAGEAK